MLDRSTIVARLREMARLLELSGESKFKVQAYERGARALEASRDPIDELIETKRLVDLPGIGKSLAGQIEELFKTGGSETLRALTEKFPSSLVALLDVPGVTPAIARTLYEQLEVKSVEDAKAACKAGRVRDLPGFGTKREAKILEALERFEAAGSILLIDEAERLAKVVTNALGGVPGIKSVHRAGSLRRALETTESIAIVVESDDPDRAAGVIENTLKGSVGEAKRDDTRVEIETSSRARIAIDVCKPETTATTVLYRTGSHDHVAKLEARAAERGMKLDITGLRDASGKAIALADEGQIYASLDVRFVPPELREDVGEIEAALKGDTFDLIEESQLRGLVHCHTTWSDGKSTLEEMVRAAEESGAEYITITDHSGAAFYASGLDVERLKRQWDEIAALQEKFRIRILRGTESDILAEGALDWPDAILEKLDVVIASIHNRHGHSEAQMTERLIRVMKHPIFKIWGHPLGRMLSSRPPFEAQVLNVLDALAESRGAVEINGDPKRLDLEPKWARAARERGIAFVLSVDAHSVPEITNTRYAAAMARRAGVRTSEVLNAKSVDDFRRAVAPSS